MIYTNIWDALETLINGITGLGAEYVYNYEPKQPDWYPCVSITPNTSTELLFGSASTQAEIPYNIRVMVQYDDLGTQENKIREMVDDILNALRTDPYLWNLALKSQYEVERWYTNEEQSNRIAIIKATYTTLIC